MRLGIRRHTQVDQFQFLYLTNGQHRDEVGVLLLECDEPAVAVVVAVGRVAAWIIGTLVIPEFENLRDLTSVQLGLIISIFPENNHLLRNGKYCCTMSDLVFWIHLPCYNYQQVESNPVKQEVSSAVFLSMRVFSDIVFQELPNKLLYLSNHT